jgi:hypothetical protein
MCSISKSESASMCDVQFFPPLNVSLRFGYGSLISVTVYFEVLTVNYEIKLMERRKEVSSRGFTPIGAQLR